MIYLIDGHNLIGKMPNIKLSDPDDEQKLVTHLQNWARLDRKRKVQVVFDAGRYGGFGDLMSGLNVDVRFSRMGQTADDVIIRQLKELRNPQEYTLVSSDRAIFSVAKKRRVGYILSEEFVALMDEEKAAMKAFAEQAPPPADPSIDEEIEVSDAEVNEWINLFEQAPKRPRPERPQISAKSRTDAKEKEKELPSQKQQPPASTEDLKSGEASLTREELKDWMAMFDDAPPPAPREETDTARPSVAKRPKRPKAVPKVEENDKFGQDKLSKEDVDEWLNWFGQEGS